MTDINLTGKGARGVELMRALEEWREAGGSTFAVVEAIEKFAGTILLKCPACSAEKNVPRLLGDPPANSIDVHCDRHGSVDDSAQRTGADQC